MGNRGARREFHRPREGSVTAGVEISRYDPRHDPPLSHLLGLIWTPDARLNARHADWKYWSNPSDGTRVYVARSGGAIVAMRGFFGARYVAGMDTPAPRVLCTGDLTIAPDFRGRGVFTSLMETALNDLEREGCDFLLNFSANAAVRLGSLAAGWGTTRPVTRLRRNIATSAKTNPWRDKAVGVARRFEKSATRAGTAVRGLMRWSPFGLIGESQADSSGVVASSEPRPSAMAALLHGLESDGRIHHVHDESYLRWRFQSPLSMYRFFYLGESELEAYIVVQARHYPMRGRVVRIADWAGITPEARARVLRSAMARLEGLTVEVWASSLTRADIAALESGGFTPHASAGTTDYQPAVLVRPAASRIPPRPWLFSGVDPLELANWNVRFLDSDGT